MSVTCAVFIKSWLNLTSLMLYHSYIRVCLTKKLHSILLVRAPSIHGPDQEDMQLLLVENIAASFSEPWLLEVPQSSIPGGQKLLLEPDMEL